MASRPHVIPTGAALQDRAAKWRDLNPADALPTHHPLSQRAPSGSKPHPPLKSSPLHADNPTGGVNLVIRGLYSSANGLLVESARTDVISANLAGISVPGYRRDMPTVAAFDRRLRYTAATLAAGPSGPAQILVPAARVDLSPGLSKRTGRRLDVALDGPGYFCVRTSTGEAYTRGGAFQIDAAQRLVTASGDPVLGQAGPVRIIGGDVTIAENGDILVDGARVDRLNLVDLPSGARVQKLGGGLLRPAPGAGRVTPANSAVRVRQGYLEQANVEPVAELAAMIAALRAFEASQRALQANDQTLDKAINDIGRV